MNTDTLFEFAVRGARAQAEVHKLCNQPLSHNKDPQTSYDAAEKMVKSGKLNKQEQEVWSAFLGLRSSWGWRGCTAKELAKYMSGSNERNYYTIQRRLSGLRKKGKIKRTGENRNGCCVWELVYRS